MNKISLILQKQTYSFDDGKCVSGVVVQICPMVFKFIAISDQKLQLLSEIRPDFYQWYINAPAGSNLVLSEDSQPVSVVVK